MKTKLIPFTLFTVILFFFAAMESKGQETKPYVKYVSATTSEGLLFNARIANQNIKYGRDIIVYYTIKNQSRKPIYLVRDKTSKTVIEDDHIIFPSPFVPIGGHEEYLYGFVKILPNTSYQGRLTVIKDEYGKAQFWTVIVGFGYIININGLNPLPDQINDPAPFKWLLNLRLKTLELSSLSVNVKQN